MEAPGFWDDQSKANTVLKEKAGLERSLQDLEVLARKLDDLKAMAELASEEGGQSMKDELEQGVTAIQKEISSTEIAALLSGKQDALNAIVSIHPGAGGTEAQDWAEILMRMYLRWAEKHGYRTEILDYRSLHGHLTGIDLKLLCYHLLDLLLNRHRQPPLVSASLVGSSIDATRPSRRRR